MALTLASLKKVKADEPPRIVLYGPPGVGKTSLAAEFPNPVFLQTEEGTPGDLELTSFGLVQSFADFMGACKALHDEDHDFKTIVVDTLDNLERLVWQQTCTDNNYTTIEDPGFGKGYVQADLVWQKVITAMKLLRQARGMTVVLIAHCESARYDDPILGPYNKYVLTLHKRGQSVVVDDADIVMFVDQMKSLKKTDVGFNKSVAHAEGGGSRMMYLEQRPGFIAKNRYGMPAQLPFKKGKGFLAMAPHVLAFEQYAEKPAKKKEQAAA